MTQIVYPFDPTVYPFDPHGTNVVCYIKNEANSLLSSFGTHRCVIPKAAPFYKKDFVITSAGVPLKEGKDFYFGHQYVRGTHQTAQAIYGSIYIINDKITLPVSITYRSLGGQYTVLGAVITAYLANSLTDPTTARWEDVCGELYFPPVDIAYDIDNWKGEAELITAINDVGTAIESQDPLNNESVNAFENWIQEEERIVNDSNWPVHLADSGSSGGNPTPDTGIVVNYLYSQEWGTFQTIFGQGETPGTAFNWIPESIGNRSYVEDGGSWRYDSFNNFLFNDISTAYNSATGTPYGDDNTTFNKSYCGVVNRAPSYYTANVHFAPVTDYINDADSAAADYTYGSPGLVSMVLRHRWGFRGEPQPRSVIFRGEPQQLSVIFSPDGGKRNSLGLYENTVSLWYNYGYSDAVCIAGVRGNLNIPEMSTSFEGIPGFNILVNLQPDVVRITIYVFVTDYHSFTFEVPVPDIEVYYPDITDGSFGIGAYRQPYVYVTDNMLQEDVWEVTTVGTDNTYGFALDPNHDTMGGKISYIGPNYGFAYNYDEPVNYRDMGHWNIEWYDDKPTLVLESLYRIVDSDTIACQSTDDGYTATYSGKLTDNGYTFYQLKTPLSAGSGTFYMWRDFGQPMDIRLVKGIPGVAGIVVKYQPGEQLDLIIDPTNMFNSNNGGLQLWYNYNQPNGHLIAGSGISGLFKDGYARWDEIGGSNPMRLTIDFLPDGLHVTLAYGPDYMLKLSLYVPAVQMANAVFDYKTFVVESKIGFGGWMQPFIEFAGQWIKEYGYTYNEPSQPTGHGSNPHNTLWYQAGALKSDGIAQNANSITGLTIDQLASEVAAQQNVHPERYFPLNAPREITGDLILKDGLAHIARYAKDTTGENEAFIQLGSGNSHINGDRNLTIAADKYKNTPGAVATLQSGSNILKVVSSGSAQEADKLFFNDQLVLTSATLQNHLPMDSNASLSVATQSTTTMTFSGKGSTVDPLKVTINYPLGSTSVKGIVKLTSALDNSHPTYAGTPLAVKTLNDRLSGLIPTTRTVNNLALNKSIVITASMLGINNIDNITDANLPVNAYYQTELDKYSPADHSHASTEFSLTHATNAVLGIVKYAYNLTGTDNALALSSYVYNDLASRLSAIENQAFLKVPANALKLNRYGVSTYLPVPAIATYPAAGPNTISLTTVGEIEVDGTLVVLRNGADILETGVYYAYMSLNTDGSIKKYTATTTKYQPAFLPAGVTAKAVYRGHAGVFILRDSTDSYYVVLTNGTMDSKYHVASKITNTLSWGHQLMPIIVGNYVYFIFHQFSSFVYYFTADRVAISSIGKGNVTTTSLLFSGTDPFGTVQTSVASYYLVPSGISTDPTAKKMAIDTSGGKWTGRSIRQASLNYDMVAEGNKVRVMSYISTYFSNAYASAGNRFNTSYVIDFDLLTATLDTLDSFPIVFGTDGLPVTTLPKGGETIGFPGASANNTACVIRTRGKTFALNSYGIERPPYIAAFKYNTDLSEFERLRDVNVNSAMLGGWTNFTGNYGSVVHQNCKNIQFIKGNQFVASNADGTYTRAEYSLTSTYVQGDSGYGPTTNRVVISQSRYNQIKKTIFNATLGYSDGAVLYDGALSNSSKYEPSTDTLSNTISISTTAFNALKAALFAQVGSTDGGTRFISAVMSLYVSNDPQYPVIAVYTYRAYTDDTATTSSTKCIVGSVSVDSRVSINSANLTMVIYTSLIANGATGLSSWNDKTAVAEVAVLADSSLLFVLGSNAYIYNVGDDNGYTINLVYTPSNATWAYKQVVITRPHLPTGNLYTADKGLFVIGNHSSGEGITMSFRGNTLAAISSGVGTGFGFFSSSRVAEGWYVYMSEAMPYTSKGVRYTLPAQSMDIRNYFPGDYQNRTFYLYVDVQNGIPLYVWSSVKNPDSDTATYLGYCTTDTTRITALVVERVTRLGDFRELVNHRNSLTAHGIGNNTKTTIGLSQVANKAPAYTLKTTAFSDVFNTWLRFSHLTSSWAQPALASEANAWIYDTATDSIKCTQNTTTYVGFISPTKIADYEFDTVVGLPSSSADGDNDVLAIVIGYVEISGVQHTLSVLRTNNIDQGPGMAFETQLGVYYDYQLPDQKTVAKVDTSASETPTIWRGKYSRIFVKRVGDTFTVKATKIDANTWATVTDSDYIFTMTFTLDDLPELAIFKGPTQYGYGAYSQMDAQFINYLRPDLDGRNFYATTTEVLKAAYWQQNAVIQSGTIAHGATLPIPAGLTRAQCKYYVFPGDTMVMLGTTGWSAMSVSYDPNTFVVNGTVRNLSGVNKPINLNYVVLAAPGFKLLK